MHSNTLSAQLTYLSLASLFTAFELSTPNFQKHCTGRFNAPSMYGTASEGKEKTHFSTSCIDLSISRSPCRVKKAFTALTYIDSGTINLATCLTACLLVGLAREIRNCTSSSTQACSSFSLLSYNHSKEEIRSGPSSPDAFKLDHVLPHGNRENLKVNLKHDLLHMFVADMHQHISSLPACHALFFVLLLLREH